MTRPQLMMCLPFEAGADPLAWSEGAPLGSWASAVEDAGFDAVAVTDHPFPTSEWLPTGHHALDPFVALTAMATATTRVRLVTDVLVAGYRNPYLLAKSVASLDVISGGRLCVGIGAGYQRGEFAALGARFEGRGQLFDAALDAIYRTLDGQEVIDEEGPFPAPGNICRPIPVQSPRPPFWIGGNSTAAMRRAAARADGWMPFPQPRSRVSISLSPALGSLDALAQRIVEAQNLRATTGLPPLTICSAVFGRVADDELADTLEACGNAGVTWVRLRAPGTTMAASIQRLHELAAALGH
ncbi:TIGR03619 family F420-dependent LLM class oxidoreductase [Mycolicibacterium moriokaense]|uniref:Putative F420-dependent oxidoreductase n=1 Tax=Mycolicibacterium moriokaense TaxID=39691 RepID=A0A318H8H3_9MYCO|nr:TIGR03619 family F420-dependent LLM class oxidoreductase [Mycolicibacterium moriokaense]PXX01673.1 putative F420-dependent oxidoreductase [Mycolicibacterium moriokaense]